MGRNSAPSEERLDSDSLMTPPLRITPTDPPRAGGRYRTPGAAGSSRLTHAPHGPHDTGNTAQTTAPRASRRRATTARPVRPEDKAVVERTTELLAALALVEPATAPTASMPEESSAVTVIPTSGKVPAVPPMPRAPRRTAPRSLHLGLAHWLIAGTLVTSVLYVATPIGDQFIPRPFAPHGAQVGPGHDTILSAPWATSSFMANLDIGGGAGPGISAPGSAGLPVLPTSKPTPSPQPRNPPSSTTGISPAPLSPWPPSNPWMFVPHHPAFAVGSSGGFYSWAFGQCTWWAQYKRRDENLRHMGNARFWAAGASARGYRVGTAPVRSATVVFQPGVQGAGGAGHVAHVEAVYPGGWFLVSEMNFFWNGGGLARVDYRYAHAGAGVSFIY